MEIILTKNRPDALDHYKDCAGIKSKDKPELDFVHDIDVIHNASPKVRQFLRYIALMDKNVCKKCKNQAFILLGYKR